ncbi:MAG: glycoside hydrolase family 99-like domain-containing protein, partial [Syntrophobacteraceae bacterium]
MLFDSDWYLTQYPDVAKAGVNPLVHYLRHGANEGRDPNPDFDSDWYLKQYPDVAKAGVNPLRHFLLRGGIEQRDPSPLFNTRKYLQMHPEVALAKLNPFAHFFRSGKLQLPVPTDDSIGPPAGDPKLMEVEPSGNLWAALNSSELPPEQEDSSYESMAALLHSSYRSRIENLVLPRPEAFSVGDHEYTQCAAALEFRHAAVPLVSIVIPVCNQLSYTLECLTSISRHSDGIDYEVVVIDDDSSDATPEILSRIANLVYVRNNQNLGFIRSCNRGAERSRGKYILFFANDAQATRGWLRPLIETFDRHANVGAVGPKILYPSGRLQEAGICVNHDGTSTLVGLLDDPSLPQYNRLREVPYCSRVCLALERKIFLDIGGFDEELAPAYCEDCDLGFRLRRLGLRVIYNPKAVVLHHLSVTSDHLVEKTSVVRNQQKLAERWQREIDELNEVKLIAFYLPQFHPIPENDRWWGKGFTEWTNVAKARPNYFGHYQPHIPADLGFYDLRLDAVREQQGLLARRYGIYGFCYYYYWFAGKRLLEEPLERMLETNKPDLPFCLMWANENWTRRWDGQEKHILIAQQHSDEDDLAVMQDLIRYLKHRNYIRVNGRPLLIVYRVSLFPSILRTTEIWRELCHREGIGDIYLAMAESFEYTRSSVNPASLGFDAAVEFPPHGMSAAIPPPGAVINPKFNGVIHDYRQAVAAELRLPKSAHVRFRSAIPTWDNTARRQDDPLMFEHTSPGAYQAWIEAIIESTRQ